MKSETPSSILRHCKNIGEYLGMSSFFVFQIVTNILINQEQNEFLIQLYANQITYLLIVLGLIEWGYFSADRIITECLKSSDGTSKFAVFATPLFVQITIITDLVYFMIGTWAPFEAHITDLEQKHFLHEKLLQAHFFSLGTLFTTAIFFYGKRIWNNIRKRDLISEINA